MIYPTIERDRLFLPLILKEFNSYSETHTNVNESYLKCDQSQRKTLLIGEVGLRSPQWTCIAFHESTVLETACDDRSKSARLPIGIEGNAMDLEKAKLDPSSVFDAPAAVCNSVELTPEQKIEILRRWEYDARELQVAAEENMGEGPGKLLDEGASRGWGR
jgi:hypothetical protein